MRTDIVKACERYGLAYTEACDLPINRRRCGRGFTYVGGSGKTIKDQRVLKRIRGLAIPPAWQEVAIAAGENCHLQAVGRDTEGRLQYLYHPQWDEVRSGLKRRHLVHLGHALPRIRRKIRELLREPGFDREKLTAATVRLIDRALLRPGHEEYARQHAARGAATLLKRNVEISGDRIKLHFRGKGGKELSREFRDPTLAKLLGKLCSNPGRRLFALPDGGGNITARDVNAFLSKNCEHAISAKDFRTFRASAEALSVLASHNGESSPNERERHLIEAADQVSEALGNTRAIARSSYIHPAVIEGYRAEALRPGLFRGDKPKGLTRSERALLRLLERPPKAE